MTVRDMENATGLTRANIRFYENQGLLTVERGENNYRHYTRDHVQTLLKIKLLRSLGMSIERIRDLQQGRESMDAALEEQTRELEKQIDQLQRSAQVCRQMRTDGVDFQSMDARRYLDAMERRSINLQSAMYRDREPRVSVPWQRYLARWVDVWLVSCGLTVLCFAIRDGVAPQSTLWLNLLSWLVALALEAVLLHLVGTTPGKWIFGLRVEYPEGGRLSLYDSFWRGWGVLQHGQGWNIPIYSLYRMWKSYEAHADGEILPWEEIGEVIPKDKKPIRFAAAALAVALCFGCTLGCIALTMLPDHRGDITAAQFCENFRHTLALNGWDTYPYVLHDDGTWTCEPEENTTYVEVRGNRGMPDFQFETENGTVRAVTVSEELTGPQEQWICSRTDLIHIMTMTMLTARKEYNILSTEHEKLLQQIQDDPFEGFSLTVCGVRFTYEVEYSGYHTASFGSSGILIDDDDPETEPCYAMRYTMEIVG